MSDYERHRIEIKFKEFTSKNFEKPTKCRNLEQIRYYIRELCHTIEEMESKHSFVPTGAYSLLAQYNARQNSFINQEFTRNYC